MPIKIYKPTTAGRRKASVDAFSDVTKKAPEKSLVTGMRKSGGRNAHGRITVRHRGGGAKRKYRLVDFKRDKYDVPATVAAVEYDPNRGARIALLAYADGEKRYIIAPAGVSVGDKVVSSKEKVEAAVGNRMPLMHIPAGLFVHDVELVPGNGGMMVRGAGAQAQIMAIEGDTVQLKLPSGEMRLVSKHCSATVGQVSNPDYRRVRLGKAGRMRHLGIRPTVRGKAMNPVDHPHGGGEGRNPIGLKGGPKTPWGKKALGVKTRKPKKPSGKYIVRDRRKARRR